jgi:hypothetical protein
MLGQFTVDNAIDKLIEGLQVPKVAGASKRQIEGI